MEHHRCFWVYITKTQATQISDMVFFKHQCIRNPTISPESHVVAAAQQVTITVQGNIPTGNKTAEELWKVIKLFTKIAMAKNKAVKAKANCNRVCATQATWQATHLPRMEAPIPRVKTPIPRVIANLEAHRTLANCHPTRRLKQTTNCYQPASAMANCTGPRVTIQFEATSIPTHLHLPGWRQQPITHETNHQIGSQKHHAGSNAVMCGHIQAKIHCIHRLGDLKLYQNPKTYRDNIHSDPQADGTTQTPHEVVMQNGKPSAGSTWRTLGLPPPHCVCVCVSGLRLWMGYCNAWDTNL